MTAETSEHGSQNVLFVGEVEGDDVEYAPGLPIVQKIEEALRDHAWEIVEPFENRDGALYDMVVKEGTAEMRMLFAGTEKDTWMLQIAPSRFIGRFRHRVPSATSLDVFSMAKELHEILFVEGSFRDPKWCWDGFPDEMETFPEPPAPEVPALLVRPHRIRWPWDWSCLKDPNCVAGLIIIAINLVGLVFVMRAIVRWALHLFR